MNIPGKSSGPCACCQSGQGSCTLTCRSVSGTAHLCGFPKFTSGGTPAFYHNKQISGSMAIGGAPGLTGAPCNPPALPNSAVFSGTCGTIGCTCGDFTFQGTIFPLGTGGTAGTTKYQANIQVHCQGLPFSGGTLTGLGFNWSDGNQHDLTNGLIGSVFVNAGTCTLISCSSPDGYSIEVGCDNIPQYTDAWNVANSVDSTTCVEVDSDSSTRSFNANTCSFPGGSGSVVQTGGFPDLPSYGSIAPNIITDTTVTATGTGTCVLGGFPPLGTYALAQGVVLAMLTNRDTKQQAIARANPSPVWAACPCTVCTSFSDDPSFLNPDPTSFAYRKVQVQGTAGGLVIGGNYTMVIGFYSRTLGTTDPFTFHSSQTVNYVAEATTENTDFIDVPQVDGLEIEAKTCGNIRTG